MKSAATAFLSLALAFIGGGYLLANNSAQQSNEPSREQQSSNQNSMRQMMQSMMGDVVPPGVTPATLPAPRSEGAKLVAAYCAQCHNLPNPVMHSATEWPSIANRMFRREEMMSGHMGGMMGGGMMRGKGMMNVNAPTPGEQNTIVEYLKNYSLRSVHAGALPEPRTEGATLFAGTCSRCHALPNPKAHTAAQWPGVVTRMQENMKTMGKSGITHQERQTILSYLQSHASDSK